jgi:addiction module HigA family antidote
MLNVHEVVDRDGKALRSPDLFHPGYVLKEEIESREIAKKDFAELMNILPTHLSEIFAGKRPIGPKLARRIETALGISAGFWLRMQSEYDLKVAEQEADPVLIKIEDILQIQHKSNASLAKAIVAYDVASGGVVVVRALPIGTQRSVTSKGAKLVAKDVYAAKSGKLTPHKEKHVKKTR